MTFAQLSYSNILIHTTSSCIRIDADFSAKAKAQTLTDGTTAVIAIIHQNRVIVGNGTFIKICIAKPASLTDFFPLFSPCNSGRFASNNSTERWKSKGYVSGPSTRQVFPIHDSSNRGDAIFQSLSFAL